jgi:hypothetical protein
MRGLPDQRESASSAPAEFGKFDQLAIASAAGADALLTKPIDFVALRTEIDERGVIVGRRSSELMFALGHVWTAKRAVHVTSAFHPLATEL